MNRGLTPYQCEVLTNCLETVQVYFHAGGRGLKRSFLQRSPELHNLQQALALYSQTTDALLKDYVTTEVFIMGASTLVTICHAYITGSTLSSTSKVNLPRYLTRVRGII